MVILVLIRVDSAGMAVVEPDVVIPGAGAKLAR